MSSRDKHPRNDPSDAAPETGGGAPEGISRDAGRRRKKILIIDDDPNIVLFFKALFEDEGYATCVARDGEEAMRVFRAEKPDLITLDIAMPKGWGPRFHHRLTQDGTTNIPPVIVVSGMPAGRHAVPGAKAFLTKPVKPGELLSHVRAILG